MILYNWYKIKKILYNREKFLTVNRKEKIYSYINSAEYIPLTFDELALVLDVPDQDLQEFSEILEELKNEGRIFLSKKNRFAPSEKNGVLSGTLRCNPRGMYGFVTTEDGLGDVYISPSDMSTAIDGDTVLVKLTKSRSGKRDGIITSVLARNNTTISAVMTDDFTAKPDNPRIFKNILLEELGDAKKGDRVLVELTEFAQNGKIYGEVVSVLGNSYELKSYTDAIVFANGIKPHFPQDVIAMADATPSEVLAEDLVGREDLTDKIIFTIDGEDARDFDDAVSLEYAENGNYILGVHIADVTHYVTENSPIDKEAYQRGTSVYLADRVIPMLPKRLSNGICSLNPHVVRLTLSVFMEIDKNGDVVNHRISKAYIRSLHRMTYTDVAKILDGDQELLEKYSDVTDTLTQMNALAKILLKRRIRRGSINFDFPESKIIMSEDGLPKEIVKVVRNDAHKLIEEFMLIANETVAEFMNGIEAPFIYRIHEKPTQEKAKTFQTFAQTLGVNARFQADDVKPYDYKNILEKANGLPFYSVLNRVMLRSMQKARYSADNMGHFGLASNCYCHFTSPIRRYPDLCIHRIIKEVLHGNYEQALKKYSDFVVRAAEQSSECERRATDAERDVDDLYKTMYMSERIGEEYDAVISGVTSFGLFAELPNTIEGFIPIESLYGRFSYDPEHFKLVGIDATYTIGETLRIKVTDVDFYRRRTEFRLLKKAQNTPPMYATNDK